ncbi:hypothetical protein Pmar_PMAR015473 [Perkinsus marinus ATCC 50983]|uniref:Uncharacterized protein n=1 Tax=Perkinsus marinus (strain ATCC 50983 / TXsc) TaxID=423536 RepID=C5L8A4_PERM5|nr:hypothetical protein Pmar_PMAR015473 [Perkinsus marinus ATCC 50983]EER07060.1 hypothetical protein Pmar_PMAR015473 [Perkinsus marinus ATCC 50983]|eukprot:XP_002775244.1 hypothetical protein Pmar_PMAR015473 [Perkinsus marinus ATCC 50983]
MLSTAYRDEDVEVRDSVFTRIIRYIITPSIEERTRIRCLYRNTANSYGEEQQQALMMTSLQGEVENSMPIINTTIMDTSNYKPRYLYRYLNVLRWLLLLVAGYAYNRFFIEVYHIPHDSDKYTYLGHSINLANLAMFGIIQAWFVEVIDDPKRSKWIFSLRRWWFFITFFAASTVFTLLGMLDVLSHSSISPSGHLDNWNAFSIVLTFLASFLALLIIWHVVYSIKVLPTYADAAVYIISRVGVVCIFGITFLLIHYDDKYNKHDDNPVTFHLHHYFIAWLLSLIAAFDHPISLLMLSITSGIFVQGIAAYSAAGIFFRPRSDGGGIVNILSG